MKLNQSSLIFITLAALVGCSTTLPIQEIPPTANATDELKSLDTDLESATANQVNVLSPNNYQQSKDSERQAKKSLDKQKSPKDTLHNIAVARAYLKRANEIAAISRSNMEEVVTARQEAITAHAPELFAGDFNDADKDLRDATADLENNDPRAAAKHRATLQAAYLDLELRAIKQSNLGRAKTTYDKAVAAGAKEFAPQSLAIADKTYKDAEAYITGNRHDTDQVQSRAKLATDSADHLLKITQGSKKTEKVSPEQLTLQMESKQNQVNAKTNDLAAEQSQTRGLKADVASLETENAMNAQFEQARTQFSKEEAEVYKQGNKLVIRLRGLEFPKAQAVLRGENFPLLAKVQRVIKDFANSSVVVEGHTDSIGGKAANDKLSQDRAQAVTEYLVANNEISKDKVKAIGYGFQKPLASNKTAAGRAQNRRVDVIIEPENTKTL